eukprot:gene2412-3259_t
MNERKVEDEDPPRHGYSMISTERYYGKNSSSLHLPFFCAIRLPPGPTEIPIIPSLVAEACGLKIITGGMMGAVMGVGMGLFMGAMGDVSPIQIIQGREVPQAPLREQLRAALAIDEGAKHRPLKTAMQAVRSGNGFKLNGAKAFVVDGHTADLLIVAARSAGAAGEHDGLTLFLVDPKAKGVALERTAMVDSHNAARIVFDNVEVDADSVLGDVDQGAGLLDAVLNIGRGAVASEMVGLSDEVFNRTVTYLKERKQFGRLIGEFQALQHRAAHLYTEIEITRAAVLKALQLLDDGAPTAAAAV